MKLDTPLFRPRLLDSLSAYDRASFARDVGAGLTVGVVAMPLAMAFAIASGLPVGMIAGEFIEQRVVTTSNGLSALLSVWYSRSTRSHYASYDIMFGAGVGDATQAEVLITA